MEIFRTKIYWMGVPLSVNMIVSIYLFATPFMAFYAVDEDDLIFAEQADPRKTYWCLECSGPVKRRKGRFRFAHFYHLKAAPSCRLHSKSENHLLAQRQLQRYFPKTEVQIENPFPQINRIADGCWEKRRIVFEIQCSAMGEKEAEMRIRDYRSIGYEVIWLLDDQHYNKRLLRPAEAFLRQAGGYYITVRRFEIYDQFEIFASESRVKKSSPLFIDLQKIYRNPNRSFHPKDFPKQITQLSCVYYFFGDRLYRALQNDSLSMFYWRSLEIQWAKSFRKKAKIKYWLYRYIVEPYLRMLARWVKER